MKTTMGIQGNNLVTMSSLISQRIDIVPWTRNWKFISTKIVVGSRVDSFFTQRLCFPCRLFVQFQATCRFVVRVNKAPTGDLSSFGCVILGCMKVWRVQFQYGWLLYLYPLVTQLRKPTDLMFLNSGWTYYVVGQLARDNWKDLRKKNTIRGNQVNSGKSPSPLNRSAVPFFRLRRHVKTSPKVATQSVGQWGACKSKKAFRWIH